MKAKHIALILIFGLIVIVPRAWAWSPPTPVALVPTAKPIVRSYPGVTSDILGIRTGMTLAQAKAVAAKHYTGKAHENEKTSTIGTNYKGTLAYSKPFVAQVDMSNNDNSDYLIMKFGSDVSGNTAYELRRALSFPNNPTKEPTVSAVKEALIKKYGPPSYQPNPAQVFW
ncbi:MAG TPA: hypothetical protein VMU87_20935 [Stellaceae bacterium]|nr:hypothetical protein [Stellaceae bacterium]